MTRKLRMLAAASSVLAITAAAAITAAGSAAAATVDASGSASVFVPAALNPHELCVSSATTGTHCKDVPGVPAITLNADFTAHGTVTPPSASIAPCAGGAIVTIASGGASLTGTASVSGLLLSPTTIPFGPGATPTDTFVVSFCDKA